MSYSRREFIFYCTASLVSTAFECHAWPFKAQDPINSGTDDITGRIFKNDAPKTLWKWSRESYIYEKLSENRVLCGVCPNKCVLSPGDRSICRSKVNIDGKLYTLVYGNPCSANIDPIEKKPLYHFYPKTKAFSIATTGCNFRCLNCQNWEISQSKPEEVRSFELFPADVVKLCQREKCESIAYTYSEATTFYEYMIDTAKIAHENNIYNLWISNGYINTDPLNKLCNFLNAANVNLKSYSDAIYMKLNGGKLRPVLNTFITLKEKGVHFEITHLVVPGYVDQETQFIQLCDWILSELGPSYPLHISRFFPQYKLDKLPPTPISTLTRFREIAMKAGILYVYVGNVPDHEGNHTYCHNCKKMIVQRIGYSIPQLNIKDGKCTFCQAVIPGVWG